MDNYRRFFFLWAENNKELVKFVVSLKLFASDGNMEEL